MRREIIKTILLSLLLGFLYLAITYCSELVYFQEYRTSEFYIIFTEFLRTITRVFKFSVGDLFYAFYSFYICYLLLRLMFFKLDWKIKLLKCLNLALFLSIISISSFQYFWGFNYLSTTLDSDMEIKKEEVYQLSKWMVNQTNTYSKYQKDSLDFKENIEALEKGFFNIQETMLISSVKSSMYSPVLNYLGIGGYYNPFTGESQVNTKMLSIKMPMTMAHEMAHQIGFAKENEASYMGFLACVNQEDNYIKYTAYYKATKYLLNALAEVDIEKFESLMEKIKPSVKEDFEKERIESEKYSGKAEDAFSKLNDTFLKLNQQKDGIISYSRFTELLLHKYKHTLKKGVSNDFYQY